MSYVNELDIKAIVTNALKEDLKTEDITTVSFIPQDKFIKAAVLAKENCIVCGLGVAGLAFRLKNRNIKFKAKVKDGDIVKKGKVLAVISGSARSILSAERVALNFLNLLSGVSTRTRKFVNTVRPYKVKIMDTRKTIPGLRLLEKYAVRIGGGFNHRLSLDEMVLVKDNHLKIIKGYKNLKGIEKVKERYKTELEVKNLRELKEALKLNPDIIMLDNMAIKDIRKAVRLRNSLLPNAYYLPPKLEASGGVTLKNIKKIASLGVEIISVGELTDSPASVDISLEVV
ncbi:MAG: carboxylating nicotinate-nucleotide diphosphorylase [Candidatus Omnitrophica bacterium]|nr:carboxylating nicotinate-nucleotide diphosphorylase [Candidatus Omnitrophota bacterium]MDD5237722.1 carboxylating nicotinate-nucleotide diphosphorylase [Candidatus Omnitrophota bacterium]